MRESFFRTIAEGAHEPTQKRVRAELDGETVVDSVRAMLVWEPRRIVPSYAVPLEDVRGELVADPRESAENGPSVLHPGIPFDLHTAPGDRLLLSASGGDRSVAAFLPADPELAGYVVLDFAGFDAWREEEEAIVGHPRDPFHRIDILHSSRHVAISLGGTVIADSRRPVMLFETNLPPRFYLPSEDVRADLLVASPTRMRCAYKGEASYWSLEGVAEGLDLAWTYVAPLREAAEVTGLIAFFDERVDVVLDGERRTRPITPWSPRGDQGSSAALR